MLLDYYIIILGGVSYVGHSHLLIIYLIPSANRCFIEVFLFIFGRVIDEDHYCI